MSKLTGVIIIPTGIGCALGGDASYLTGVNLIAKCCNKLLANPNACNASDLNTMADNVLYTEGSTLDRFLEGFINLKETKTYNKILCVVNPPLTPASVNAVNAARWCLGADITLLELKTPLTMSAFMNADGTAGGDFAGQDELIEQVKDLDFDVLTIHTTIDCSEEIADKYWTGQISVNPWGRCESLLSKYLSFRLNKQAVHSPMDFLQDNYYNKQIVKPSQAAEIISNTYSFCMYKGTVKSPKIDLCRDTNNLSNTDIDFMISPVCWSRPHEACLKANIPIIIVKENTTCIKNVVFPENKNIIFVENYLEAAGIVMCMNANVHYKMVLLDKK